MRLPTSYHFWVLVTAIAFILISAYVVQFAGRSKKIVFSKDDCNRIITGMTWEECVSTLGGPPGDYSKGLVVPFSERMDFNAFDWISDDGKIRVWFSEDNKVEKCEFQRVTIWKLTWRDMIRRRFGL